MFDDQLVQLAIDCAELVYGAHQACNLVAALHVFTHLGLADYVLELVSHLLVVLSTQLDCVVYCARLVGLQPVVVVLLLRAERLAGLSDLKCQ